MFLLEMLLSQDWSSSRWWIDSSERLLGLVDDSTFSISFAIFIFTEKDLYLWSLDQVIADFLSNEEVEGIKEIFARIDNDNDGIVSTDELKVGLKNSNSQMTETEIQMLIEAVSLPSLTQYTYSHTSLWYLCNLIVTYS